MAIARAGAAAGCREALFTLGDKPELRYRSARSISRARLRSRSPTSPPPPQRVRADRPVPHLNPGTMSADEIALLRGVSLSQGIMLESASERLCRNGGPHFGSPDKVPVARLETIRLAGEARVPFTTGILIGIGETRRERIEALLALRDLHDRYGHIQEIIVQNFRAKPGTRMAARPSPRSRSSSGRGGGPPAVWNRHVDAGPPTSAGGSRHWCMPESTTGAACRR